MKKICVLVVAIIAFFNGISQSRVEPVEFQKIVRQGVICEFPYPPSITEQAIEDKFTKMGYKSKSTKGFRVFTGVRMAELGSDMYDIYYTVDRKSRKDKDNSKVTLLVSKGLEQFVSDTMEQMVFKNAQTYLSNFGPTIVAYDLEVQIKDQQAALTKNEKKAANLIEDAANLQKDKAKLEKKIADNEQDQVKQKAEVETQKQILNTLISKRKS